MPGKFKAKQIFIIIPSIALLGYIGYRVFQAVRFKSDIQQSGPGQSGGGGRGGAGGRMQTVQTGVVTSGRINEYVVLTGALKAKNHIDLNPRIQGRIVKIEVDTGQAVTAGSLVAMIEDDEIRQQVERSKAAIAVVDDGDDIQHPGIHRRNPVGRHRGQQRDSLDRSHQSTATS